MRLALALVGFAALAGCGKPPINTQDGGAPGRSVDLMAVAPDGTNLWRFDAGSRDVYFASSGAQWTESCGKNCRRDVHVPTADPLEAASK